MVHLVLHPHGIAPTFLKLDLWSPGVGFIPIIIISTKGINQIKKKNYKKKVLCILKDLIHFLIYGCNSTSTITYDFRAG